MATDGLRATSPWACPTRSSRGWGSTWHRVTGSRPTPAVGLRLWPSRPEPGSLPEGALLRGVPAAAPWSWLELEAPRLAEQRRRSMEAQGRRGAVALLLGSCPW